MTLHPGDLVSARIDVEKRLRPAGSMAYFDDRAAGFGACGSESNRMRIWTVHPRYLDTKGLLAAWREALLAQKVLQGETKGYRNHPQLSRFKAQRDPPGAISRYLRFIYEEAASRGYQFSEDKIGASDASALIDCARGQLLYEWNHLKEKLRSRDLKKYNELVSIEEPEAHPLFRIVEGDVESWEVTGERI